MHHYLESSSQPGLNGGVKAVLRNSEGFLEELEVAYLISAEGAHSTARQKLNLQFLGKSHRQSYALADLHLDGDIPDDELSIFTAEHGFLGVFPMGNRHFRFIATDPDKHEKTDDAPAWEELQKLYDEDSHIPVRLRDSAVALLEAITEKIKTNFRQHTVKTCIIMK